MHDILLSANLTAKTLRTKSTDKAKTLSLPPFELKKIFHYDDLAGLLRLIQAFAPLMMARDKVGL